MLNRAIQPENCNVAFNVSALPENFTLPNGIKVYSIGIPSTELIRVDFMFRGGQWTQSHPLQANMTCKLMRDATRHYPHGQIAEKLDFYGAVIDSSVNMSYARIGVTCLKKFLPNVLPIVLDMIQEPEFSSDRLAMALSKAKVSYDVSMQTVGEQCKRLFYKAMFAEGHPMTLFPESLDYSTLTVEHLQTYVNQTFCLNNCVAFLTGNLDETTLGYVSFMLNGLSARYPSSFNGFGELDNYALLQRRFFHKMEIPAVQACLRMGCRTIPRTHQDYVPLVVLTTLFGGYFGSRLMSNIRESKGYTYDIHSSLFQTPQNVLLSIRTETSAEYVDNVVEEVYREMDRLANEPITSDELIRVKNYILGYMCRTYENSFSLSSRMMNLCSNGLELNDIVEEAKRIESVTPDELISVCQRYYKPTDMVECVVS